MAKFIPIDNRPHPGPEEDFKKIIDKTPGADNWIVTFSYNIHFHSKQSRGSDIDVIILAPGLGVFTGEIKGLYNISSKKKQWLFGVGGAKGFRRGRSPFDQIHENFQEFKTHIIDSGKRDKNNKKMTQIGIHKVIIFPRCDFLHDSPAHPKDMVIDRSDIENIGLIESLKAIAQKNRSIARDEFSYNPDYYQSPPQLCDELVNYLFPSGTGHLSVATLSKIINEEIIKYTEQQYRYLNASAGSRLNVFSGYASTGKTFIAVEKAIRSALQGKDVLLLFPINNLKEKWQQCIYRHEKRIEINTFGGFASRIVRKYSQKENKSTLGNDWEKMTDMANEIIIEEAIKYDCVVVDEAQELKYNQLDMIEYLVGGFDDKGYGDVLLAGDFESQNLLSKNQDDILKKIRKYKFNELVLTENCRNSPAIVKELENNYDIKYTGCIKTNIDLPEVEYIWCKEDKIEFLTKLDGTISEWHQGGVKLKNIRIVHDLFGDRENELIELINDNTSYKIVTKSGGPGIFLYVDSETSEIIWPQTEKYTNEIIYASSILKYRGLDNDFIIAIMPKDKDRASTMISRAKVAVKCFGWEKDKEKFFKHF